MQTGEVFDDSVT